METALTTVLALLLIAIGLLGVYSGYKFFKVYLSIVAFIFGFVFTQGLFEATSIISIILACLVGLVFSTLSFAFYKLAVFIAFASFGASFGSWLLSNYVQIDNPLWLTILGAAIGFFIAMFMLLVRVDKYAIIFITTLLGAYYVLAGVSGLIEGGLLQISLTGDLLPTSLSRLNYITGRAVGLVMTNTTYLIAFVFLISTGLLTQIKNYRKH